MDLSRISEELKNDIVMNFQNADRPFGRHIEENMVYLFPEAGGADGIRAVLAEKGIETDPKKRGAALKAERQKLGVSTRDLAKYMGAESSGAVSKIEGGSFKVWDALMRYEKALALLKDELKDAPLKEINEEKEQIKKIRGRKNPLNLSALKIPEEVYTVMMEYLKGMASVTITDINEMREHVERYDKINNWLNMVEVETGGEK